MQLAEFVGGGSVCVLTGAGISTASGIPDYRGPASQHRSAPIQHHQFVESEATRRRYWARSVVGWPWMEERRPNGAHLSVAALESHGLVQRLVTQNVDGLHQKAGSTAPIELHGSLSRVVCLTCERKETRSSYQERLLSANDGAVSSLIRGDAGGVSARPDGDAEINGAAVEAFAVPSCRHCGGVLMPDIVFFGGTVPRAVVDEAFAAVDATASLLVLGSSLTVFSGFRFVKHASERGKTVVIVNDGPTRADGLATLKVEGRLEKILPAVERALFV